MPKTLTEADIRLAAEQLGIEVAAIRAVDEVESRGRGFLADGRVRILFERHKFHQFTRGMFSKSHSDISNPKAGGYGKAGEHQYARFSKAFELDPEAAMKSASWGRYQIMGFNHKPAGFDTVGQFVDAMKVSEGSQLIAFVSLIKSFGLTGELKSHDWASFARQYNGVGYKKNKYDTKLAEAYEKFKNQAFTRGDPETFPSEIDTHPEPDKPAEPEKSPAPAEPKTETQDTVTVQKVLQSLGSKVMAGGTAVMGVVTAVVGAFLGVIRNPYAFTMLVLGGAAIGAYLWNQSKERQVRLQLDLNEKAASQTKNTVEVSPPPTGDAA